MKTLAFFNNKGGIGKTTLVYNLAWMFADMEKRVLVADFDPQANLTSMFLTQAELEKLWEPDDIRDQSVVEPLTPVTRSSGGISLAPLQAIAPNLRLIPGDLNLSNLESDLSEAWSKCLDRQEPDFQTTSSLYHIIRQAVAEFEADLVLIDVGSTFDAVNRAALICADAVVIPTAPELFSIQGMRNVGPALENWRREWKVRLAQNPAGDLPLPAAVMEPLGYVVLQFGLRDNRPISAYEKWARRIPSAFAENVLGDAPAESRPVLPGATQDDPHCLGVLRRYRSLFLMASDARKPLFQLKPADGALGSHTLSVKECEKDFRQLASRILERFKTADALQ